MYKYIYVYIHIFIYVYVYKYIYIQIFHSPFEPHVAVPTVMILIWGGYD